MAHSYRPYENLSVVFWTSEYTDLLGNVDWKIQTRPRRMEAITTFLYSCGHPHHVCWWCQLPSQYTTQQVLPTCMQNLVEIRPAMFWAYLELKFQRRYCHRTPSVRRSPISTSPAKPMGRSGWNLAAMFHSWLLMGIAKLVPVPWL